MQIDLARLGAAGLVALLLSACQLKSESPLLDPANGAKALSDAFVLIEEHGDALIDDDGDITAMAGVYTDGRYTLMKGDNTPSGEILSLHRLDNVPFDYLGQMTTADGTNYVPVRLTQDRLFATGIELDSDMRDALKRRGIETTYREQSDWTASAADLRAIVSFWTEQRYADLLKTSFYKRSYRLGDTPEEYKQLLLAALTQGCLAAAGAPDDPVLQTLPEKLWAKLRSGKIDTARATQYCDWARTETTASPSVRFALSRLLRETGKTDEAVAIQAELLEARFGPVIVQRARTLAFATVPDPKGARAVLEANADDPIVQYALGRYLGWGRLGEVDHANAFRYVQSAASGGIVAAYNTLGEYHAQGLGVTKNPERAVALYQLGAEGGDRDAVVSLGMAYYFGDGVRKDHEEAFKHVKRAAELEDANAQYMYGFMLANGQGTTKAESSAVTWLTKSADAGNRFAKTYLGYMTYYGRGIDADHSKGLALMREGEKLGDAQATKYLAQIEGTNLPPLGDVPPSVRDDVEALAGNKPFQLNQINMPFMSGLGEYLLKTCGLPGSSGDRAELATLVLNGASFALGGNDYSNPDLGKTLSNMTGNAALYAAGLALGKQLDCGSGTAAQMAEGLAEASRSNKQAAGGGQSVFVEGCQRQFSEMQCTCLAQIGRGAIPDIYQRPYDRNIIAELIQRNPLLGLTIGLTCGISNY